MLKNNSETNWLLIAEEDGEVLSEIRFGESISIKSKERTRADEMYVPTQKLQGRFIKMIKDNQEELVEKLKEFPSVFVALFLMTKYIKYNYNVLLKDGKKYKCIDLANDLGVSRQTASTYISKLKELNILAEIESSRGKLLAVNPRYFVNGTKVPKEVVNLFKN